MRRAQGNRVYEHHCLRDMGRVALALGNHALAASRFSAALEIAYLIGADHCKSYCFDEAASVSTDLEAAAQLLGASAAIRDRLELPSIPSERNLRADTTHKLTEVLGAAQFEASFNAGRTLSSMDAYEVARHALSTVLDQVAGTDSPLTPREREVLILIAEGKSDREIGDALFVSRRTAATHVRNLFAKLDVHSRAEAAAWAVRNDVA
jgi:DNA-binding CsgD family transcriptional regulator